MSGRRAWRWSAFGRACACVLLGATVCRGAGLLAQTADQPPPGGPGIALSGTTAEGSWRLTGARLSGGMDGPLSVDSIVVRHGDAEIHAAKGMWFPDSRIVELHGSVTIRDSVRTLWAEHGFYHRDLRRLELEENVRGKGPEGDLYADRLRYDRAESTLTLSGAVRLIEEGRRLQCSWLHYDLADSSARAGEPVLIHTDADSVDIHGRLLFYDRPAGRMTILGGEGERPYLERTFGDSTAPLTVTADTLEMGTGTREGEAFGNVVMVYEGAQATCGRALFQMPSDRVVMGGRPIVWDEEGAITGDSMAIQLVQGRADRLVVWGHARSEYRPRSRPEERTFATGDSLTAYLDGGRVRSVLLAGAAEALYLPDGEAREEGTGLNWTKARRLRLALAEGGVERVQFEGETEGLYISPYKGSTPASGEVGEPRALAPPADPSAAASGSSGESPSPAREADAPAHAQAQEPGGSRAQPAADEDPLEAFGRGAEGGYAPEILSAIRAGAREGRLRPSDELLARLPFDPRETVLYEGDRIDFEVADETMKIEGNGVVHYQTMGLRSKEITFYAGRDLVVAAGEPVLSDKDSEVVGEEMTYRIDRRQGLIRQGRSQLGTGYYVGERVKRADPQSLFVQEGSFSTCSEESTHFHFQARRMKVIPGERVVARPVVLYIGHIPVLAIPFAVFPINRGRQSGVLIPDAEVGFDSSRGRFLRNIGYYWAPNDYLDALGWVDYYEEEPRTIFNLKGQYRVRYLLSGQVEASFGRQGGDETVRRDRWLLRIGHDQTIGERASLKISGNFQSDKDYASDRDFGADVDDRINQVLRSQVSFNKSWSSASLSIFADRTESLENPDASGKACSAQRISQAVPSINLSLNSLPLGVKPDARGHGGRLPWLASSYLRGDVRFRSIYSKNWCDEVETNQATGLNLSLSDNRRLLGAFTLTPSAALSAAWAAKDEQGGKNRTGLSWSAGVSAGSVLYGTFFPRLGPWEGLRHVVEWNASYSYRPELRNLEGFPSVGGIGLSSAKSSTLGLRMTQRFHFKWRSGEQVVKDENLLVWSSSVNYDFLAEERATGTEKARPWSDISHNIRLEPGRFLSTDVSISHDPELWRDDYQLSLRNTLRLKGGEGGAGRTSAAVGSESAPSSVSEGYGGFGDPSASIQPGPGGGTGLASLSGPWNMTVSHVLTKSADRAERSSVNLSLGLSATTSWRLQYSLYYDLTEKEVTSQGYSLYRDLHCWQAMFERRESGGRSSYYFRISIKDLPDVKYERRRF